MQESALGCLECTWVLPYPLMSKLPHQKIVSKINSSTLPDKW